MYDSTTDTFRIKPTGNISMAAPANISALRRDSHMRAVMQHRNTTRRMQGGMAEAIAEPDAAADYWAHVRYGHAPDVTARFSDVV
ncbi:hypothetical protein [Streptomyces sp. NPDC088762]|uniref:hypothetical protein n=1 Tax=Streptomyces sp. NPDC088762 TaxID=3365891 RepID=UPI00381480D5